MANENGQMTKYQEIKAAFKADPQEAKLQFGLQRSREEILKNDTLFLGNCVLNKDGIQAMYDYMRFDAPLKFEKCAGKHNLTFSIGDIKYNFANGVGKGACISCSNEDRPKMQQFADLLFPSACIRFE